MSHKDPSHSSSQRTLLWTIIPATVFLTLMLVRWNHNVTPEREALKADIGMPKVEKKHAEPTMEVHAAPADTTHSDTTHVEHAPEAAAEGHHH